MSKVNSYLPRLGLKLNRVKYGKKLKLGGWPFIFRFPQASMEIGDDCAVNSNFISNLIGLYQRTIIIARGRGKVRIGNHVGISGSTIYARELATAFHKFYNACRCRVENESLMQARLNLCLAVRITLRNVLSLMKIQAPEVM